MIDEMIFNIHEIKTYEFKKFTFLDTFTKVRFGSSLLCMQKKDLKTSINYEFSLYLDL